MKTIKKIKDLVKITKGRHYPSTSNSQFWDHKNGFLWLKINDIKPHIYDSQCKLSSEGVATIKNAQNFLFKKNSFVMAIDGSIGKIGWLKKDCFSSTHLINFNCDDLILKKYLYYFFKKKRKRLLNSKSGTAMPSIKLHQLENVEINLPDRQTQKEIIEELDFLHHHCQKQKKSLETERSFYQELIDFKLHYFFNDFKDHQYQKKFIKDLVKINNGRHYPSPLKSQFWDHKNGFLWLKIGDIKPYTYDSQCKLSYKGIETIKNNQKFLFKKDSFVMATVGVGSVGKVGWLKNDFYSSTAIVNFDCDDLILKKYLYYFFKKNRQKIEWFQNGTTGLKSIKLWQLENLKINLPDRQTQKEIVEELDHHHHHYHQKKKLIKETKKLYQELIDFKLHYFFNF